VNAVLAGKARQRYNGVTIDRRDPADRRCGNGVIRCEPNNAGSGDLPANGREVLMKPRIIRIVRPEGYDDEARGEGVWG
jgi:hypothetical protein